MTENNFREQLAAEAAEAQKVWSQDDAAGETSPAGAGRKAKPAKYEQMKRIEGRIKPRQEVNLDSIRRTLIERRTAPGERITNNTLLRVALSGLIAHKDTLAGNTEKEIEDSWLAFLERAKRAANEAQQHS